LNRMPLFPTGHGFKGLRAFKRMRVTKFNTLLRVLYTLGLPLILSQVASAQSVLNFAKVAVKDDVTAGFAVANPTSVYADVQFTLYGLDGNPVSSGLVNPVRYRVGPNAQLSMRATELFAGSKIDGWVQVTSPTSGLTGSYLLGDFSTKLEGSDSSRALTIQMIPYIRENQRSHTEIEIVNPGSTTTSGTVIVYNAAGAEVGSRPYNLAGHAALRVAASSLIANPPAENLSAKITANAAGVAALAVVDRGDALLFAGGQPADQPSTVAVAPHYLSGNGFDPILVLNNPTGSNVSVTVTLFGQNGDAPLAPAPQRITIPANGSRSLTTVEVLGRVVFGAQINGWLRVESPNVSLTGSLVLDQGANATIIPLETHPVDRSIYGHIYEDSSMSPFTGFAFVNPSSSTANVDMFLIREDGTTLARKSIEISQNSKVSKLVRDVFPESVGLKGSYVFVRSSAPIYGMNVIGASGFLATIVPGSVNANFTPGDPTMPPKIISVDPGTQLLPGSNVNVTVDVSIAGDVQFLLGDQIIRGTMSPVGGIFNFDVPQQIEPGFVNLRVRVAGVDSAPVLLRILPVDNLATQTMSGRAFYQKIDLRDTGLDLDHPVLVPIRNARVELINTVSQVLIAVSETDNAGRFNVPVPSDPNLSVRVISRLRNSTLRVQDNTNLNAFYATPAIDIDGRTPPAEVVLTDTSRVSGAFNILEMVQRANDTVRSADPTLTLPGPTIFWSSKNTNRYGSPAIGLIGTTMFNLGNNTAYILGDRSTDSDEFDDPVIIHEYAHMLAAKFSRDDSPGGPHGLGDQLDPRVAWSEGWADFFSSVVRNDPIWRDSNGPNGVNVLRYDLEENVPVGDNPGYWSEASVDGILWDLYDDHPDDRDDVQYSFAQIWAAFTAMKDNRFVYLPYFLEHFLDRNPAATDAVAGIVQARSIDFQPNVRPSATYPFPKPMNVNSTETGYVDSLTSRRADLVTSSHLYEFTTTGGAATIRLDITDLGPGNNPNANDLDLFLLDSNGRVVAQSDSGLNGQSERIATRLPAGTYVIEIRSFYMRAETGGYVFNSGSYRLSLAIQ
jgi:hypothetical protein